MRILRSLATTLLASVLLSSAVAAGCSSSSSSTPAGTASGSDGGAPTTADAGADAGECHDCDHRHGRARAVPRRPRPGLRRVPHADWRRRQAGHVEVPRRKSELRLHRQGRHGGERVCREPHDAQSRGPRDVVRRADPDGDHRRHRRRARRALPDHAVPGVLDAHARGSGLDHPVPPDRPAERQRRPGRLPVLRPEPACPADRRDEGPAHDARARPIRATPRPSAGATSRRSPV